MIRKALITIVGGLLTIAGIALLALPGPAWLLLPIGLAILSLEYPWAKIWLRKSQRQFYASAAWLDRKILLWKMNRS
ncbi:PGPGW domain-containing protein [Shewanella benthica]|uniref:PGPGW domain-containing protein n=1 Tax=Shewanella TaxID=22 RepID=UPI00187A1F6D|nr:MULTISPECIES: PGPGW domain-containing protein [Shewanella]MBE7216034.1 PGPGW domain-containing protein [Shewanella benthica]MBL4814471.1 PGPGW domain-containing protein [Shewanella sp.]MCJ8304614.1 PGPGW domain-containing protein [Shewanella sp.]MCL1063704.1 PGPGW domain-containing protein [Shewanella benthica]